MTQAIRNPEAWTRRSVEELAARVEREEDDEPKVGLFSPAFGAYPIGSQICWIRKSILSSETMMQKYQDRLAALRRKLSDLEAERSARAEPQRRKLARSGVRGVYPDERTGKWRANTGPRKKVYLGIYPTIEAAKAAIQRFEERRKDRA